MKKFLALIIIIIMAAPAYGARKIQPDELVVTPSKLEQAQWQSGSPMVVIRRDEIVRSGVEFLADLLKRIPELEVVQEGGPGGRTLVHIRGVNPAHVLVMMDRARVNNPATGAFDIGSVRVDDIQRIEIVKGAQSALYDPAAVGGVINIITRKGGGKFNLALGYEGGSDNTSMPFASISGGRKYIYWLGASRYGTDGISAAIDGPEADANDNTSYSGSFMMPIGRSGLLEANAWYSNDKTNLDSLVPDEAASDTLVVIDDPDSWMERERLVYSLKGRFIVDSHLEQVLFFSESREQLRRKDPTSPALYNSTTGTVTTSPLDEESETITRLAEYQSNFFESDGGIAVFGLVHREDSIEADPAYGYMVNTVDNNAAYINLQWFDGLYMFTAGARYNKQDDLEAQNTYRLAVFQDDEGIRYRASYATGYRLPTPQELYYPATGNPDLLPELSQGWEVGFEKDTSKDAIFAMTYFHQDVENLIEWGPSTPALNIEEAKLQGVEVHISKRPHRGLGYLLAYSWLDARNLSTGMPLSTRPKHKAQVNLEMIGRSGSLLLAYTYVGERYDDLKVRELGDYGVLNLSATYSLGKSFELFGRADNILREEYEEATGYSTAGRRYFGGLRAEF